MAAAAILNFRNFKNVNGRNDQEGRSASAYEISSKLLELRPRCGYFLIFFQDGGKMAAAATLDL